MVRRSQFWFVVASLFVLGNLGGAVVAIRGDEPGHAILHLGLVAVGAYVALRIAARQRREHAHAAAPALQTDPRLDRLQQSLDAIALEVERIGEAQRFILKRASEHADVPRKPPQ